MRSSPGGAVKGSYAPAASQKHGLTLSLGDESPFGKSREWNAGRRAASRDGGRAAPLGAEDKDQRLPAFRFLFLFPGSERKKPKLLERY